MKTSLINFIIVSFILNTLGPIPLAQAQELRLPVPGIMVQLSLPEKPPVLKGVTVYPNNPFKFDFILDKGDISPTLNETSKLVKYFLAAITTPENDLWVNLSPYEKNRIIPTSFGQTDMGRDLLAEDYILKQITASLIYPEGEIGRQFWKRVYEEAQKKFGTTNIPVNTFNKVWIVPEHAKVYEHNNTAFIVNAKLKVMLEQDYLALEKNTVILSEAKDLKIPLGSSASPQNDVNALGSQIVREIVIPQLEKEVNEGQNFATLRQVYYSLVLAVWFKKRMKASILGQKYMDQNKVTGIHYGHSVILSEAKDLKTPLDSSATPQNDIEFIYQRYLKAFKKGVYNYIKEEPDPATQEMIPRKYFSGGFQGHFAMTTIDYAQTITRNEATVPNAAEVTVNLASTKPSPPVTPAMISSVVKHLKKALGLTKLSTFETLVDRSLQNSPYFWQAEFNISRETDHKFDREDIKIFARSLGPLIRLKGGDIAPVVKQAAATATSRVTPSFETKEGRGEKQWGGILDKFLKVLIKDKIEHNDYHIRVKDVGTSYGGNILSISTALYKGLAAYAHEEFPWMPEQEIDAWVHKWHVTIEAYDVRLESLVSAGRMFSKGDSWIKVEPIYTDLRDKSQEGLLYTTRAEIVFATNVFEVLIEESLEKGEQTRDRVTGALNAHAFNPAYSGAFITTSNVDVYNITVAPKNTGQNIPPSPPAAHHAMITAEEQSLPAANSAMKTIRLEDIERLKPRVGVVTTIMQEYKGHLQSVPNKIVSVTQDEHQKTLFHLEVLSLATDLISHYDYDVLHDLNTFEFPESKELPDFKARETVMKVMLPTQGVWSTQTVDTILYTNRLYYKYSLLKHKDEPDFSEDGRKWHLYFRPADVESLDRVITAVKAAARVFDGAVEFQYVSKNQSNRDKKLIALPSVFEANFVSEKDAREFHQILKKDTGYLSTFGLQPQVKAGVLGALDSITSIDVGPYHRPISSATGHQAMITAEERSTPASAAMNAVEHLKEIDEEVRSEFGLKRREALDPSYFDTFKKKGEGSKAIVYVDPNDDPKNFYKVFKSNYEKQGMAELENLKVLAGVEGVPRFLDWGFVKGGGIWLHLEGEEDTTSIEIRDGRNLKISDDWDNFSFSERLDIFVQVAQTLETAHEMGLGHGDVKPLNIIVSRKKVRAILADWDTARPLGEGQLDGTEEYMAPDGKTEDRSDVFSLGLTMGNLPFLFPLNIQMRKEMTALWDLRERMHSNDVNQRPYMREVVRTLRELADKVAASPLPIAPDTKGLIGRTWDMIKKYILIKGQTRDLTAEMNKTHQIKFSKIEGKQEFILGRLEASSALIYVIHTSQGAFAYPLQMAISGQEEGDTRQFKEMNGRIMEQIREQFGEKVVSMDLVQVPGLQVSSPEAEQQSKFVMDLFRSALPQDAAAKMRVYQLITSVASDKNLLRAAQIVLDSNGMKVEVADYIPSDRSLIKKVSTYSLSNIFINRAKEANEAMQTVDASYLKLFSDTWNQQRFDKFTYDGILRDSDGNEIPLIQGRPGGRENLIFHTDKDPLNQLHFRLPQPPLDGKMIKFVENSFKLGVPFGIVPPSVRVRIGNKDFLVVASIEPVEGTRNLGDLLIQNSMDERYIDAVADLFQTMVQNRLYLMDPKPSNIVVGYLNGRLAAWVVDAELLRQNNGWSEADVAINMLNNISQGHFRWPRNNLFFERIRTLLKENTDETSSLTPLVAHQAMITAEERFSHNFGTVSSSLGSKIYALASVNPLAEPLQAHLTGIILNYFRPFQLGEKKLTGSLDQIQKGLDGLSAEIQQAQYLDDGQKQSLNGEVGKLTGFIDNFRNSTQVSQPAANQSMNVKNMMQGPLDAFEGDVSLRDKIERMSSFQYAQWLSSAPNAQRVFPNKPVTEITKDDLYAEVIQRPQFRGMKGKLTDETVSQAIEQRWSIAQALGYSPSDFVDPSNANKQWMGAMSPGYRGQGKTEGASLKGYISFKDWRKDFTPEKTAEFRSKFLRSGITGGFKIIPPYEKLVLSIVRRSEDIIFYGYSKEDVQKALLLAASVFGIDKITTSTAVDFREYGSFNTVLAVRVKASLETGQPFGISMLPDKLRAPEWLEFSNLNHAMNTQSANITKRSFLKRLGTLVAATGLSQGVSQAESIVTAISNRVSEGSSPRHKLNVLGHDHVGVELIDDVYDLFKDIDSRVNGAETVEEASIEVRAGNILKLKKAKSAVYNYRLDISEIKKILTVNLQTHIGIEATDGEINADEKLLQKYNEKEKLLKKMGLNDLEISNLFLLALGPGLFLKHLDPDIKKMKEGLVIVPLEDETIKKQGIDIFRNIMRAIDSLAEHDPSLEKEIKKVAAKIISNRSLTKGLFDEGWVKPLLKRKAKPRAFFKDYDKNQEIIDNIITNALKYVDQFKENMTARDESFYGKSKEELKLNDLVVVFGRIHAPPLYERFKDDPAVDPILKILSQTYMQEGPANAALAAPGGIDFTAKRMDLEVEKDKGAVSQTMDLKALENIEINGLYIKDIEVKPLKNLPEILGVSTS